MKYSFTIQGKPVGKGRPRLGKYATYTPSKTKQYEAFVKWTFINQFKEIKKLEGPISANIIAIFEIPKSYSSKKRAELNLQKNYIHKPDTDNIAKIILDSLNEIAYYDDSQISKLSVKKEYGEENKVIVELEEI